MFDFSFFEGLLDEISVLNDEKSGSITSTEPDYLSRGRQIESLALSSIKPLEGDSEDIVTDIFAIKAKDLTALTKKVAAMVTALSQEVTGGCYDSESIARLEDVLNTKYLSLYPIKLRCSSDLHPLDQALISHYIERCDCAVGIEQQCQKEISVGPLLGRLKKRIEGSTRYLIAHKSENHTTYCRSFSLELADLIIKAATVEQINRCLCLPEEERREDILYNGLFVTEEPYLREDGSCPCMLYTGDEPFLDYYLEVFKERNYPSKEVSTKESRELSGRENIKAYSWSYRLLPDMVRLHGDVPIIVAFDSSSRGGSFIALAKSILFSLGEQKRNTREYKKAVSDSYARSYQTKRNIPARVLKGMKESSFNKYFGFVEIDESCDINVVEDFSKEFHAFMGLFGDMTFADNSIRFRRLGNHKASGLYYPSLLCLCVDINSPDAIIHELGHLLDHRFGNLSEKFSFCAVRDVYKTALETTIRDGGEDLRKRMSGSTKYNKKYYLEPTEVFARCFEMYVKYILKIDNSLVNPQGFAYPFKDDELMELIKTYFSGFEEKYVKRK